MGQQYFKGDLLELKFFDSGNLILSNLSLQKDDFWNGAQACFVLGEILFDSNRSPLSNAIPRNIFRESFATIFESFLLAGSFESYLIVFRNIFGDDVDVTFMIPSPGKLEINIIASGIAIYDFIAKSIVGNAYQFDTIIDDESDTIVFQGIKGLETQAEVEQMLFEMVPSGIYTEISLTIGGS